MGWIPSLEELIALAERTLVTLLEDVERFGRWLAVKLATLRDEM